MESKFPGMENYSTRVSFMIASLLNRDAWKVCQKSSVFASSCTGLTSSGYVGQTRKNFLCKDELLFMSYMIEDRFFSMMEDLGVCTHILNVSNNKDSNSNYSALNVY